MSLLMLNRFFTKSAVHPLSEIHYIQANAVIRDVDGSIVFEMKNVEVPDFWSPLAVDILVSKYFRKAGVPETGHETSIQQVISRITRAIQAEGVRKNYFTTEVSEIFEAELAYVLLHQIAAFNSPVWFNVGLFETYGIKTFEKPQCSACFIQSVEDDLMAIYELMKTEAKLFKYGSGTGTNFSKIRGKEEKLSGGGYSSGLISFLEVLDRGAGAIQSGGTTRRAAKMVCLDVDHPEIKNFIEWKKKEELKVAALIKAGYSADFNGEAYHTVAGQNANHSVRVSDLFLQAVLEDKPWQTRARTTHEVLSTFPASDLWRSIAEAAWACADPGLQFDDTINEWHTCSQTDRIYASNPCSEYMFLDDTACNLASINLVKFLRADGSFAVDAYQHAIRLLILAQEILVDYSSYPTDKIEKNSHDFRPLGLGYANLGTLLMRKGMAYDSDEGRNWAATLTAILTGTAYMVSAEIAQKKGAFIGFAKNRESMLRVLEKHEQALSHLDVSLIPEELFQVAKESWFRARELGNKQGFRNAQVSVLAPTGTIGLLMDCDTTGIEPEFALVKYKKLAGGGYFKMVNQSVAAALQYLGYEDEKLKAILAFLESELTFEGAPQFRPEHLPVFDCADRNGTRGTRFIAPLGHLRMMAAVQPFLSGAISKTVNLPQETSVQEVESLHWQAWKLGLKSIAIYRNGCKSSQPLSTVLESKQETQSNHSLPGWTEAPLCNFCGHSTVRNASCYRCLNCGNSMGCS